MTIVEKQTDCPQPALGECQLLGRIFAQRLGQDVTPAPIDEISRSDRAQLIGRFVTLLRQLSSLIRVSGDDNGSASLNAVLDRLMTLVTDALDAERSSLFLYDTETDELFSRIAQGTLHDEIRFPAGRGIAGAVFHNGQPIYIADAYSDPRFNPQIDEQTGFLTRSVLCVPLRNWDNRIIGVTEVLNKRKGDFDAEDQVLLEALTSHAASALESKQLYENFERALHDEAQLLGVTTALSSELKLDALLLKIMEITTEILTADRSTLLLYDEASNELRSKVAQGLETKEIRISAEAGIAGAVFATGRTMNIQDAYTDPRFNPLVDRATGYRTRSILCVPVISHSAEKLGIIQVLNKRGGPFSKRDEKRLQALAAQAAIAIENARLFEAVLNARNYSESILQSLSNGVITLDAQRRIIKANPAARRILNQEPETIRGVRCNQVFTERNRWVMEALDKVERLQVSEAVLDADIHVSGDETVSVNLNVEPLIDIHRQPIGFMLVLEDITAEKRVKSTMARYMSHELTERLLETGGSILGGQAQEVTVLFSDIKNFTGLTENLGARATVSFLNEYFSEMAELVFHYGGILDKYIGDAIMAVFGTPFPGPDDARNAVTVAVKMMQALRRLNARRQLAGHEPIAIRLGIGSGEVIAGNIGSNRRMDYTVIGHTVNVASRVESANKFYGTRILVTGETLAKLDGTHRVRELDLIRVKGGSTPVSIHEVLDAWDHDELPDPDRLTDVFAEGIAHFRRHDWARASASFKEALAVRPGDGPSILYLNRCAGYAENPPGDDWDGVWNMAHK